MTNVFATFRFLPFLQRNGMMDDGDHGNVDLRNDGRGRVMAVSLLLLACL